MRMKVVGLEEVYEGVAKVTLSNKGHKGFDNKLYLYIPINDIDLWPYHSEVDVTVLAAWGPAPGLAPMEHAGESSAEERDRG
jgi:hypothetical protein